MKILSVDWDYFVDANEDFRFMHFPDGNNTIIPRVQDIIWASKYMTDWNLDVKILVPQLDILKTVLYDRYSPLPAGAGVEHDGILKFIKERTKGQVEIYNIDFHHDAQSIQKGDVPHCGNWLSALHMRKKLKKAIWIRHEPHYTDVRQKLPYWLTIDKIDIIKNIEFDAMFLCHSPAWSPPHLDSDFISTFYSMFDHGTFHKAFPNRWPGVRPLIIQMRELAKGGMNGAV
jgi:hypothetical protein